MNNIGCKVHTMVKPNQNGSREGDRSDLEVLQFLTEIHILSQATFFIGSFNSNVGALVSLLRSCGKE